MPLRDRPGPRGLRCVRDADASCSPSPRGSATVPRAAGCRSRTAHGRRPGRRGPCRGPGRRVPRPGPYADPHLPRSPGAPAPAQLSVAPHRQVPAPRHSQPASCPPPCIVRVQSRTAVASISTKRWGTDRAATPSSVAGGVEVTPSLAEARAGCPPAARGILSGGPVDDVDGRFGDVVEGGADSGERGGDVDVALLDLAGEVALGDRAAVGVPRTPARRQTSRVPVATDTCR